jgi:putative sigma-54 modulation protein
MVKVDFRHKNCHLDDSVKQLVVERLSHLGQFLDEPISAETFFGESSAKSSEDRIECEVTITSHGHVVRAHATGSEKVQAFDRTEDKLRHQLERLKGRLVARSHPHHRPVKADPALANGSDDSMISRSKRFAVVELTPDEAAFQMEMLSHSFYLFQNVETGRSAVVYRRDDGSIGLIDSEDPALP